MEKYRKARNLTGIEPVDGNPFIQGLLNDPAINPRTRKVLKKDTFIRESDGASVLFPVDDGERQYYWEDNRSFIKEYNSPYAQEKLKGMSYNAASLYNLLKAHMKPNAELVRASASEFKEYTGKTSKEMYYSAVVELIEREIIALINDGVYYVNPRIVFNGRIDALLPDAMDSYLLNRQVENKPHLGISNPKFQ